MNYEINEETKELKWIPENEQDIDTLTRLQNDITGITQTMAYKLIATGGMGTDGRADYLTYKIAKASPIDKV